MKKEREKEEAGRNGGVEMEKGENGERKRRG